MAERPFPSLGQRGELGLPSPGPGHDAPKIGRSCAHRMKPLRFSVGERHDVAQFLPAGGHHHETVEAQRDSR
jgi:hypothetical protein